MKLRDALFREPWLAYQVIEDGWADDDKFDNFNDWQLQPLLGPTLAAEDVDDIFQGYFIIAAQIVSKDAVPQPCFMDLVLPERIAEYHFLRSNDEVVREEWLHIANGTVVPAIGIEAYGVHKLFYARENPSVGINLLKKSMENAREKAYLAYDLAFLLIDEKRHEEAIEALTVFLTEQPASPSVHLLYQTRSQMYVITGQSEKALADKHLAALAFEKAFGHPPGPGDK